MAAPIYSFNAPRLNGQEQSLADYEGKVMLIVNTASKCGFTPQYEGLEKVYQHYKDKGLVVLGFPCNQFGAQEPGGKEEIQAFCQLNYGVSFPMFDKVDVNGSNTHPLYEYLKKQATGVLGSESIKWNFTKFLVNREGKVVDRFAPTTKPEDMVRDIEALL